MNCLDQTFMTRLIQYCARVFERYKVLPVVLVFLAVKFSGGMNQLVALVYFTTCQSASLSSLEFADDSTVRFLYSICKINMKKKGDSKIIQIIDQSTE
ncbi:hypothetical protein PS15m_004494 [Mucor circinelloides]